MGRFKDLTGIKINRWTILGRAEDYEVHNNGEIVAKTSQVFKAIKSYNEL